MSTIRVLIVEDDPDIMNLLESALMPGYECLRATNGLEAIQLALDGEPDLIVTDIMMPAMDGYELVQRLRRDPAFRSIPVIFLSALGSPDHIRKGYNFGAALYLTKPIDPGRFRRNVQLFIEDHGIEARSKKRPAVVVQRSFSAEKAFATQPQGPSPKEMRARLVPAQARAAEAPPVSMPMPPPPRFDSSPPERPPAAQPSARRTDISPRPAERTAEAPSPPPVEPPRSAPVEKPVEQPPPVEAVLVPRVLIVEGDTHLSERLMHALHDEFEILTADDGIEAMERAARYLPDIFVIDAAVTKMNGYQLVMMLRKNRQFHEAPIIFTTEKSSHRDRQYIEKLGVEYFLAKPFDAEELRDKLHTPLRKPGFAVRSERVNYRQALVELSLSEDVSTPEAEARRVSAVMKAERMDRKDDRDVWQD